MIYPPNLPPPASIEKCYEYQRLGSDLLSLTQFWRIYVSHLYTISEPLSRKSNSRIGAPGYFVCAHMTEAWSLGNKTQKHVPKPEKKLY